MTKKLTPPSLEHWMGTDGLGRDIFSRILYGARTSLVVACIAVSLAGLVGLAIGPLSGYFGGAVDRILTIVTDSLYAFPPLILALIISLFLGPGLVNTGIAISWAFIPFFFKVMRSIAIMYKDKPFIESAKVDGGGSFYVLRRHIIPRCLGSISILASMGVVRSIITTASLGFLGYGVQPPTPEWGLDISTARMTLLSGVWWPVLFPGLLIFVSVLGFDLLTEVISSVAEKEY
jgi:peptide/nickel transport system permease protein